LPPAFITSDDSIYNRNWRELLKRLSVIVAGVLKHFALDPLVDNRFRHPLQQAERSAGNTGDQLKSKKMKKINLLIAAIMMMLLASPACFAQSHPKVTMKDLRPLTGSWKGTLTYLDYSSNKPYTMPANLDIRPLGRINAVLFSNLYPNEPKANSLDTLLIAGRGTMIDGGTLTSKRKLPNGNIELVTEQMAKDGNDNKPATIRVTYSIGKNSFTNIKDVRFEGQTEWIKRHEYSYIRIRPHAGK
jgi:hypothetical protein